MDNLAFILYSHSSLSWVWEAFDKEQQEHFPIDCEKYVFTDGVDWDHYFLENYHYVQYQNDWSYAKRMLKCLEDVEEEFVLFHHEDMIFYNEVDMNTFEYYMSVIQQNPQFAYLKLLRGGVSNTSPQQFCFGIYSVPDDEPYRFAVQPAIWRKSALESILSACIENSIYELEEFASKYMKDNNIQCLFAYNENEDSKRGLYHWDNNQYPYIATALIKGKWNNSEYDIEIENLKRKYQLK